MTDREEILAILGRRTNRELIDDIDEMDYKIVTYAATKVELEKELTRRQSRKTFKLICDLWREYDDEPAVPRRLLHERLFKTMPKAESETDEYLLHSGIDTSLDSFAKSGSNFKLFMDIINEVFEPDSYFRYAVTRNSEVTYVQRAALTQSECVAIVAELRAKGTAAEAEATALERGSRRLVVAY